MLERRSCSPWLATLLTGAVCLSVWQMIGCPGPPGSVIISQPPAYTLLTAANASTVDSPYDIDRLPSNDYSRLVDLQDFRFLMLSGVCNESTGPLLLVIVHSAPWNGEKRTTIRQTWGELRPGIRLVFLVGMVDSESGDELLREEQRQFGDLVQGSFRDAYRNMTYKHVMALKYATYHCPRARYVLKTDDDVFVNMPTMLAFLGVELSNWGARRLLLCQPLYNSFVKRSYRSKWRVSFNEYPDKKYPTYCSGWAILYSPDVVFVLYRAAQKADYFWIDDVLITGVLAERIGIEHTPFARVLELSPSALEDMVHNKGTATAYGPFLYGPPNMTPTEIYKLWHIVKRQQHRYNIATDAAAFATASDIF